MKILNKALRLTLLVSIFSLSYSQQGGESLSASLDAVQKLISQGQEKLHLSFLPQLGDLFSKVAGPLKDVLSKLDLENAQVSFDPSSKMGAISATATVAGVTAVVRIVIGGTAPAARDTNIPITITQGQASTFKNATFSQDFQKKVQDFQQKNTSGPGGAASKAVDAVKQGLTYFSKKPGTTATPTSEDVINQALKQQPAAEAEAKKASEAAQKTGAQPTPPASSNAQKIAKLLSGYNMGLLLVLPKGFSFQSIYKDLKFLDILSFQEIAIGLGSGFVDPVFGAVQPGLSLVAKVSGDTEPFKTVVSFFNKLPVPTKIGLETPFVLQGNILPSLGGSSFHIGLPGQLSFKLGSSKIAQTDQMNIDVMLLPIPEGSIGVGGVATGISGGLTVFFNAIKSGFQPIDFKIFFAINTSLEATVTGVMDGLLSLSPVGLPLSFGNVTLTIGINPENIELLGLSELGMAGEVDFGSPGSETSLQTAIDLRLSGQDTNILLYGALVPKGTRKQALTLKDILNLAVKAFSALGVHVGQFDANIPDLGLNHAKFYFSPRNVVFANKLWKAGMLLDIGVDLFGALGSLEVAVDSSGFEATGFLSTVNLGPLTITGAGKGGQCSINDICLQSCTIPPAKAVNITTPAAQKGEAKGAFTLDKNTVPKTLESWTDYSTSKGAILNIKFKPPSDIGIFISAEIDLKAGNLGTIKTEACFSVSTKGVDAHFEEKIFNVFDTAFTLSAKDFKKPTDWYVCALFKQSALSLLRNEIQKITSAAKEKIEQGVNAAKSKVDAAERAYSDAFAKAQSGLSSAQDKVNSLKSKLDEAKRSCAGEKTAEKAGYPYQSPHPFDRKYVLTNYYLMGDVTVYGSTSYNANIGNKTILFPRNSKIPLVDPFFNNPSINTKKDPSKWVYFDNQLIKFISDASKINIDLSKNGARIPIVFTPFGGENKPSVNVLLTRDNNIITLYINQAGNQSKGYKVIFNIAEFEKYMTMTYWYSHLGQGSNKGIAIGFAFNSDNFNTKSNPNVEEVFNINILQNNIILEPIQTLTKVQEGNNKQTISYTDLLNAKILQVQSLTPQDVKTLSQIKSGGASSASQFVSSLGANAPQQKAITAEELMKQYKASKK